MNKELYISANPHETRIALSEDGELTEVYYEREREYSLAGSIYKGRVTRVLPGMQSAFVNIGLERDAFLYVSDFFEELEELDRLEDDSHPAPRRVPGPAAPSEGPGDAAEAESGSSMPGGAAASIAPGASERAAAPPDPAGAAEHEGRRRRGRRGRGHGRRGGFPDSKFARPADSSSAAAPAVGAADEPQEPVSEAAEFIPEAATPQPRAAAPAEVRSTSGAGQAAASRETYPFLLPGESLAKYRHTAAPNTERGDAAELEVEQETGAGQEFDRARIQPDSPRETAAPAAWPLVEPEPIAAQPDQDFAAGSDEESGAEEIEEPRLGSGEVTPEGASQAELRQPPETAHFEVRTEMPGEARRRRGRGGRGRGGRRRRHEAGQVNGGNDPAGAVNGGSRASGGDEHAPKLINELLHPGQEILVQIAKEPLGTKGARITSHLALPGRYLVYMPTVRHIGVSRKIASDEERARLKRLLVEHTQDLPGGFIVRTAGQSASDEDLLADIRFLSNLWNDIREQFERAKAPALLHHDLGLVERTLRDQLAADFTHIWIDSEEQYQAVLRFVGHFMPELASRVRLFTRDEPMFDHFGIQEEIDKALKSKVWLKSGGYIVINQTEALVAIDVNTGKYVGKSNRLEDTIVKTNVDAIREIVRQIRLRDLGGIIVVDFIDMDERKNRQKVMQALEEALRADRAPSKALAFNDFGLVALTRKRVKQSLERTLGAPCPYCSGVGLVKSVTTVCNEIYVEVKKMSRSIDRDEMVLRVNPEVGKALKAKNALLLNELEQLTGKMIAIKTDPMVHQEQFEIF